jgi:hypothetical protein
MRQFNAIAYANYIGVFCIAADDLIPHKTAYQVTGNLQLFSRGGNFFEYR